MSSKSMMGIRGRRQSLRQWPKHRHARTRRQVENANDECRGDHGNQRAWHASPALKKQD